MRGERQHLALVCLDPLLVSQQVFERAGAVVHGLGQAGLGVAQVVRQPGAGVQRVGLRCRAGQALGPHDLGQREGQQQHLGG